jgi:hypothetical protein
MRRTAWILVGCSAAAVAAAVAPAHGAATFAAESVATVPPPQVTPVASASPDPGDPTVTPTPTATPAPTSTPQPGAVARLSSLRVVPARVRSGHGITIRYRDTLARAVTVRIVRPGHTGSRTLSHSDRMGLNSVHWNGRLGPRRAAPGLYRVTARPSAGGAALTRALRVLAP